MNDDELKKLREKYGPSYGWTSGAAEDRAEVVAIIDEALSRVGHVTKLGIDVSGLKGTIHQQVDLIHALQEERDNARGALERSEIAVADAERERDEARAALAKARAVALEEAARLVSLRCVCLRNGELDHVLESEIRALASFPPSGQWVAADVMERVKAAGQQLFACIEGGWAMDGSPLGRAKWADAKGNLRAALGALESEASR